MSIFKKTLCVFSSVLMALTAFSFTACGSKEDPIDDTNWIPNFAKAEVVGSFICKNDDGSIIVTIKVIYNLELERVIMGFGEHIEVLAPSLLRHRIKKKLQLAYTQYIYKDIMKETPEERKYRLLREEAKRLEASVEPNNLTMEEIVAEVKKVRHKRQ